MRRHFSCSDFTGSVTSNICVQSESVQNSPVEESIRLCGHNILHLFKIFVLLTAPDGPAGKLYYKIQGLRRRGRRGEAEQKRSRSSSSSSSSSSTLPAKRLCLSDSRLPTRTSDSNPSTSESEYEVDLQWLKLNLAPQAEVDKKWVATTNARQAWLKKVDGPSLTTYVKSFPALEHSTGYRLVCFLFFKNLCGLLYVLNFALFFWGEPS